MSLHVFLGNPQEKGECGPKFHSSPRPYRHVAKQYADMGDIIRNCCEAGVEFSFEEKSNKVEKKGKSAIIVISKNKKGDYNYGIINRYLS